MHALNYIKKKKRKKTEKKKRNIPPTFSLPSLYVHIGEKILPPYQSILPPTLPIFSNKFLDRDTIYIYIYRWKKDETDKESARRRMVWWNGMVIRVCSRWRERETEKERVEGGRERDGMEAGMSRSE